MDAYGRVAHMKHNRLHFEPVRTEPVQASSTLNHAWNVRIPDIVWCLAGLNGLGLN
jgi:hypothetical protein